jgi:hypothetical protein
MNPSSVVLQEQVIEDSLASGLTLTIWRTPSGEGRIRVSGDLPYGNRDFQFDSSGGLVGTGTSTVDACPSPLRLLR